MVGNDVVDLADAETAAGACHSRFDARVLTPRELAQVAPLGCEDARRRRWILWAAKEAAYKVARANDPTVPFSPRRFEATMLGPDRAAVHHDGTVFAVEIIVTRDFVHAVSRSFPDLPGALLTGLAGIDGEDPSRAARTLAMAAVASQLGLATSDLRVARTPRRPPVVLFDGTPLIRSLSLSHHGRFAAFACFLPSPDERRRVA